MPQSTRISTQAREAMEDLVAISARLLSMAQHIHHDRIVTDDEMTDFWSLAVEHSQAMATAMARVAEVDDTTALTVAMLRGGAAGPRVRELARDYEQTHGKVVHLPFLPQHKRPMEGNPPGAA